MRLDFYTLERRAFGQAEGAHKCCASARRSQKPMKPLVVFIASEALYTFEPLSIKKGLVSWPERTLPSRMTTFLSVITQLRYTFSPVIVSCITILFLIWVFLPTFTPRKRIEFSTVPWITQPSAISELRTIAPLA